MISLVAQWSFITLFGMGWNQHLVESRPQRIRAVLKAEGVQHGTSRMSLTKCSVSACQNVGFLFIPHYLL